MNKILTGAVAKSHRLGGEALVTSGVFFANRATPYALAPSGRGGGRTRITGVEVRVGCSISLAEP